MGNDTIANMITSIKNEILKRTKIGQIPAINTIRDIRKILLRKGFMESFEEHQEDKNFFFVFTLKYGGKKKTHR